MYLSHIIVLECCVCVGGGGGYERDLGEEPGSAVVKTAVVITSLMTCFMSSEAWRAAVGSSLSVKNDCSWNTTTQHSKM